MAQQYCFIRESEIDEIYESLRTQAKPVVLYSERAFFAIQVTGIVFEGGIWVYKARLLARITSEIQMPNKPVFDLKDALPLEEQKRVTIRFSDARQQGSSKYGAMRFGK